MRRVALFLATCVAAVSAIGLCAQQADSIASINNLLQASQSVPRLIMFSGTVKDLTGKPLTGPVDLNFAIYKEQTDAAPLWQESQTLNLDEQGHYTALLGAMQPEGLPVDLFTSGEARWLGVSAGKLPEQPRVLLVSVPYALKANDAEMLGGKPASAYALAQPAGASTSAGTATAGTTGAGGAATSELATPKPKSGPKPNATGTGTQYYIPLWTDSAGTLGDSVMYQSGINVGIGTTTPMYRLDVVGGSARVTNPSGTTQMTVSGSATSGRLGQDAAGFFFSSDTNGAAVRFLTNNGGLNEWMRITSAGNVGIGTSSPTFPLSLGATTGNKLALYDSGSGVGYGLGIGPSLLQIFGPNSSARVGIGYGNSSAFTETLSIKGNNVGIGTTTPAHSLDVVGDINASTNLNAGGNLSVTGTISGNGSNLTNVNAAELGGLLPGAYAVTTGSNTFTTDQTLNAALNLAQTTGADVGVINLGGNSLIHACCPNSTGNTFVGTSAGNFTADATASLGHGQNTATGFQALQALTSGWGNTATGYKALYSTTLGSDNAANGDEALLFNSTGQDNTANGGLAMQYNTTGSYNTAVGFDALNRNCYQVASGCTANYNTALGIYAGMSSTVANANVLGANNTFLGANSGPGTATQLTNATAIGANAVVSASNALVLGSINGVNGATASVNVGIGTATPAHVLDVVGDINASTNINAGGNLAVTGTLTGNGSGLTGVSASGLSCSGCVGDTQLGVNYAGSTSKGGDAANALLLDGLASTAFQPVGSYATLGANTFTATQTISSGHVSLTSGDLDLPQTNTSGTAGVITMGGNRFLHACCGANGNTFVGSAAGTVSSSLTGVDDTALGAGALGGITSGSANTAVGYDALIGDTTAGYNAALGYGALQSATGAGNTAVGAYAGYLVSTGGYNTFVGYLAGDNPISGNDNTGLGGFALYNLTSGASNIALGWQAGEYIGTGSNNIEIGNVGVSTDSNTIRIGTQGTQTATYIAGIRGVTTGNSNAVNVVIDSAGQLGTVSSSRRFKQDIRDMGDTTNIIMGLRPVRFRYKAQGAGASEQYGLIAEEVLTVAPQLVARSQDGQIETVFYDKVNAMLLNQVQKQYRQIEKLEERLQSQEDLIQKLQLRLARLEQQEK